MTQNLKTEAMVNPPPPNEQKPFITCVLGDRQSIRFAAKLAAAFKNAGWKIKGEGYYQAISEPVDEGVKFHVHSRTENIPVLNILAATLQVFGIQPVGYVREQIPPGQFDIVIGLKPKQP